MKGFNPNREHSRGDREDHKENRKPNKISRRKFLQGAAATVVTGAPSVGKAAEKVAEMWVNPDAVYLEDNKKIIEDARDIYTKFAQMGSEWFDLGSADASKRTYPPSQHAAAEGLRSVIGQGQSFQREYDAVIREITSKSWNTKSYPDKVGVFKKLDALNGMLQQFQTTANRVKQIPGMSEFIQELRSRGGGVA